MADQTIRVNITASGEDLKREIDSDITALQRFASAANVSNKTAVSAVQSSIDAQREYLQSVNASGDAMNRLDKVAQGFEARQNAASAATASRFQTMARGFSIIETQSHASMRSIDQVIGSASQLAFGFGPAGFLGGAVVMIGVAMVRAFENAKDAIVDLRTKAEGEFEKLGQNLNADSAHDKWFASQTAFDEAQKKVDLLKRAIAGMNETEYGGGIAQELDEHELEVATAKLKELGAETDRFYMVWEDLSKLKPMKEISHELTAAQKLLKEQMKLMAEYQAKYGGDAIYNDFLKKGEKAKPFSPGADITKDVMQIKPPALNKEQFQKDILTPLDLWVHGLTNVVAAHKLLAGVSGSVFQGVLHTMTSLGGGAKAMEKALLQPIESWLEATAIKEFVAGMAALANPFEGMFIAGPHFKAAAEASAGAVLVAAIGGIGGGSGGSAGGGGGGGGGSSSASNSATQLGAGGGGAAATPIPIEITFIQKTPDGREIARMRQALQRAQDLAQPIRVTM